jgi:hypothetical protein
MRVKENKKLEKIIESESFLQIKETIEVAYEGEHNNLLQLSANNEIIAGFKEGVSFRQL